MPRLSPAPADAMAPAKPLLDQAAGVMGFTPNSLKIMARSPAMLQGFMALSLALMGPDAKLDPQLRQMIANITSMAAGCNYCQAHTAHGAERLGLSAHKIEALWSYETSEHFSAAERAALSLAQAAGSIPNQTTDEHFETLKRYFDEDEIAEIVGIISYFGFLNRWNDTLATPLEEHPLRFAEAHLIASGWKVGNHG